MADAVYRGILVVGDPHLEGRVPGFRRDEYPDVILEKLQWCLDYADANCLLPTILGDLFHLPRDNPTWMLGRLMDMFDREILAVYGNHDTANPVLDEHDSLTLFVKAGRLRLLTPDRPWRGVMSGRPVVVGGSSYRVPIPGEYAVEPSDTDDAFVVWLTHHDVTVPGYDAGRITPKELPGIDIVVNGHIHRRLDEVRVGSTLWLTPGNITRRSRNEATAEHIPSALRIDVTEAGWTHEQPTIPHSPFEDVFHDAVVDSEVDTSASAFVAGLGEMLARRTDTGAGLTSFLREHLDEFERDVAAEILTLSEEVTDSGDQ